MGLRGLRLRRNRVVEIGEDEVVEFEEAGGGQHVIGVDGGVGHEEVGHDGEQVLARQASADCFGAGTRGHNVVVPGEQRLRFIRIVEVRGQIHMADGSRCAS